VVRYLKGSISIPISNREALQDQANLIIMCNLYLNDQLNNDHLGEHALFTHFEL